MIKIDYQKILNNALKSVVKDALIHVQKYGLQDGSHFFITFKTKAEGVNIPNFLYEKYPDTMSIVLQYSFSNLNVYEKDFSVQLNFEGKPFVIKVPFASIVEFKDPSVDFMLSFNATDIETLPNNDIDFNDNKIISFDSFKK